MSDRTSYRRAAAIEAAEEANAAEYAAFKAGQDFYPLVPYVAAKKARKAAKRKATNHASNEQKNPKLSAEEKRIVDRWYYGCEFLYTDRRTQIEVIEELSGYFRKKSNLAISLGALQPCDRTFYEALMGDAALRALPYFDPDKGVKRSTFLIEAVENFLIDNSRYENRQKRKAITVPLTTMEIVAAEARGLMSEEELEDRSHGGWQHFFFMIDRTQFYDSLTAEEKLYLEWRLQGLSFDEIAQLTGYTKNTFRRKIWRIVQEKAVRFGGMEGKMIKT